MPGYTSLFDFVLAQYFLIDRIFNLDVVSVVAVNQFPQFPPIQNYQYIFQVVLIVVAVYQTAVLEMGVVYLFLLK